MKRKYQAPDISCIEIELLQLIAISTGGTTDETSGNLSRDIGYSDFNFSLPSMLDDSDSNRE